MFFDETAKIEAHESEVLCVEFSPNESGNEVSYFWISNLRNQVQGIRKENFSSKQLFLYLTSVFAIP